MSNCPPPPKDTCVSTTRVFVSDVVGSEGEIQVATSDVLASLREKGIEITKYQDGGSSPTSAAVASIPKSDDDIAVLMEESINAGGVNIPLSELLHDEALVSNTESVQESNKSDINYVTQYVKEKSTGQIMQLRIPQSPAKKKPS